MVLQQLIRARLEKAFDPVSLVVRDDSHLHAGHAGAHPGGESHFHVELVSAAFAGKGRAERHREVYRVLGSELAGERLHALSLVLRSPGES